MQRGNALFLILIAVALFAALGYAITQSGRGNGNANKEQVALQAARLISFAGTLQSAAQRLQLTGGCTADQIDFGVNFGPYGWDTVDNPLRPTDGSCDMFAPTGGGVADPKFDNSFYLAGGAWKSLAFIRTPIVNVGNPVLGNWATYPTLLMLTAASRELCDEINKRDGIVHDLSIATRYDVNTYTVPLNMDVIIGSDAGAGLAGHQQGCFKWDNSEYIAYFVVIPR
jgi:hypothetical protein